MNILALRSIWSFEFSRLFLTLRGMIYLITFGVVWFCVLRYVIDPFTASVRPKLSWSVPELEVYWRLSFDMFPILSILTAANQTASDRERGTLRFLTLRCSRDALFFGRFSAQLMIQGILIVGTLGSTLLMILVRDPSTLMSSLNSGGIIAINLLLIVLPFSALMALLSASVNSARLVMVLAILIWVLSSAVIDSISQYWPLLDVLNYLVPGMHIAELAVLPPSETFTLAPIPILQTIALLAVGRTIMARSAL